MILMAVGKLFLVGAALGLIGFYVSLKGRNHVGAVWSGAFGLACLGLGLTSDWLSEHIEPWFTYIFPPTVLASATVAFIRGQVRTRRVERQMIAELERPTGTAPPAPAKTTNRLLVELGERALPQVFFSDPRASATAMVNDPGMFERLVREVGRQLGDDAPVAPRLAAWVENVGPREVAVVAFPASVAPGAPAFLLCVLARLGGTESPRCFIARRGANVGNVLELSRQGDATPVAEIDAASDAALDIAHVRAALLAVVVSSGSA